MAEFGDVDTERVLERSVVLTLDDFRVGASGPTNVTSGTTPEAAGLRFDSTNELLSVHVLMPRDWDRTANTTLHLNWVLNAVQLNGDVLDLTIDYIAGQEGGTGVGTLKTSTQLAASTTVTTANGLAINDLYSTEVAIPFGDATNPFASATVFVFEFHLTNTTGVGSFVLLGGCLHYEALY